MHASSRRAMLALICAVALFTAFQAAESPPAARAGLLDPQVNEPVVATQVGGEVTLTGTNFGIATSARSIRFDYDGESTTISPPSSNFTAWQGGLIIFTLPLQVRSGTLTVIVDGNQSAPVELLVYMRTSLDSASPGNSQAHPLAVALDAAGTLWINDEFHTELKALGPGDLAPLAIEVPQAPGAGIFAYNVGGDVPNRLSVLGEDIDIASDGSVWFTQGGSFLYFGALDNTSRVIKYSPASGTFDCYNLPTDDAEVAGVLIDEQRGKVWYAESSFDDGNAIGNFNINGAISDCDWHPALDPRPPLCSVQSVPQCHERYVLPEANSSPMHLVRAPNGNIWFTEFWNNKIGRLVPETGVITELPLPTPIVASGPGVNVGSGPFELEFAANGDLWVTETFDATIDRVRPSLMTTLNCTQLDAFGKNPCITEMYVGTNGLDGHVLHTLSIGAGGKVWFTLSGTTVGFGSVFNSITGEPSRIGFVSPAQNNFVALLPPMSGVPNLAGIVQNQLTGDVWFAEFDARKIGRLQPASGDGDGVPDVVDNCPNSYNPLQENSDALVDQTPPLGYDDVTVANSDGLGDVCDPDDDNDGLSDTQEVAGPPCSYATGPTNRTLRDTDGDRVLDGAECALAKNPNDNTNFPLFIVQPDSDSDGLTNALDPNDADQDTDDDGVIDGYEFRNYNTSVQSHNSDGDGCNDGREIASINGDLQVNSVDLSQVAQRFTGGSGYGVPGPIHLVNMDFNKDGKISSIDLSQIALRFGLCP